MRPARQFRIHRLELVRVHAVVEGYPVEGVTLLDLVGAASGRGGGGRRARRRGTAADGLARGVALEGRAGAGVRGRREAVSLVALDLRLRRAGGSFARQGREPRDASFRAGG